MWDCNDGVDCNDWSCDWIDALATAVDARFDLAKLIEVVLVADLVAGTVAGGVMRVGCGWRWGCGCCGCCW